MFRYDGGTNFQELTAGTPEDNANPAILGDVTAELIRAGGLGGGIGSVLYNDDTASSDPDSVEFFVYNAVGHTVALSDYSSAVTQSTVYEAFGRDVAQSGTSTNNRLRNTKERDASLGLDNDGFRYYDPATGRYIQRDPIGYGDGMNVYHSVDNDPVNSVDPVGLRGRAAKKPDTGVRAGWSFQQYKQERAEIEQRIAYDRQVNGGAGKDSAFLQSRLHALDQEAERGKALGAPKRAAKAVRDVVDSGYTPGEQEMSTYEKGARAVVSLHPVGRGGLAAIDATTHIVERSADGVSVMDVGGAVVAGADNLGGGGGKKALTGGADDALKAGVRQADNAATKAAQNGATKGVDIPVEPTKRVPSPNGKKGGQAHQDRVSDAERDMQDRGLDTQREYMVDTPDGEKTRRYVDVVGKDPLTGDVVEMHQVGRQTKGGLPVARERRALDDIERATGTRPQYDPYN